MKDYVPGKTVRNWITLTFNKLWTIPKIEKWGYKNLNSLFQYIYQQL